MTRDPPLSAKAARALLGVGPLATAGEVRRAFREAAKQAHPDRPGGDEQRFRQVVAAYHKLQPKARPGPDRFAPPPAPREPDPPEADGLELDPIIAACG